MFPSSLENIFQPMDDAVIGLLQPPDSFFTPVIVLFMKAVSFFTVIEFGFALPMFLLLLQSVDCQAITATYTMLVMALLTQIPKRFIWRVRPFAAGRARCLSKIKTSSFPSRAVVGAVVYSLLLLNLIEQEGGCSPPWLPSSAWALPIVVAVTALTSVSRILLGVHYPSDCIAGAALGGVVYFLGIFLARMHIASCSSDYPEEAHKLDSDYPVPVVSLFAGIVVSVIVTATMLTGPLHFWDKCTHGCSLLMPPIVFILSFLCPSVTGHSASAPFKRPADARFLTAVLLTLTMTAAGYVTQNKKAMRSEKSRLGAFVVLLILGIVCLLTARSAH